MRIEPTVGRVVHYHPGPDHPNHGEILVALICKVNDDGTENLAIFDSCGRQFSRQRVRYAETQGDDFTGHWSWMPYQLGQAAKTEQVIRDTDHALMRHVAMEREARRAAGGSNPLDHYTEQPIPTLDDMLDGRSKAYTEAPTQQFNSDLSPNAGWTRDTRGDRPGDRFDENGVAIAEIPGAALQMSGEKPIAE